MFVSVAGNIIFHSTKHTIWGDFSKCEKPSHKMHAWLKGSRIHSITFSITKCESRFVTIPQEAFKMYQKTEPKCT
jgi:hypothetical protein